MGVEQIGIPAFVIVVMGGSVWGLLLAGKLRFGREYDDMKEQMVFWRRMALRGTSLSEKATDVAALLIGERE